jgi:hypothetical protein
MISKKKILEWHYKNTDECNMGCDADEWHKRCWRCGYVRPLERCHVIPNSLDGIDEPQNYVLLCNHCHQEAPNVANKDYMMEWICNTSISSYDTFWELRNIFDEVSNDISVHFGHGNKPNRATQEWAAKEFLNRIGDKKYLLMLGDGQNFFNSLKYTIDIVDSKQTKDA